MTARWPPQQILPLNCLGLTTMPSFKLYFFLGFVTSLSCIGFALKKHIRFKTLLYLDMSLNGLCPQYITDCLVVKRPPLDSVTARSCHGLDLLIPRTTRCSGDRAYSVAAATLWNKLPLSIRSAKDVNCFKSSVKTHLIVYETSAVTSLFRWFVFICIFACFFMFCFLSALWICWQRRIINVS